MNLVSVDQLLTHRKGAEKLHLIDVRLEEDFVKGHIPGAVNLPVFKVSFVDDIAQAGCAKSDLIVVYGAAEDSHESRMAAEKLKRCGYQNVQDFRAGLASWIESGEEVEGKTVPNDQELPTGDRNLNLSESRVEWLGRNLLNKHSGAIEIRSGYVRCVDGRLLGGKFTIDMNSISCDDIDDQPMNKVLVDHLKSDDFFDTELHPESEFEVNSVDAIADATPGKPNIRVNGELTLRGQAHSLTLDAITGVDAEGRFCAQAVFTFDRTLWGSIYGSGRFFRNVGMHLVNDLIEIQVRFVA